jgi:hypothetical protein
MEQFFTLMIKIIFWTAIVWAVICYNMAKLRGRNAWAGFFCGLLFGFLGVAYYAVAGDTVKERIFQEEEARDELEEEKARVAKEEKDSKKN